MREDCKHSRWQYDDSETKVKIPALKFPADWLVQIIPPFAGALIRFRVLKDGIDEDDWVSVYLDVDSSLGYYWGDNGSKLPYWEIYETWDNDTARFMIGEENKMLEAIELSLQAKIKGGNHGENN